MPLAFSLRKGKSAPGAKLPLLLAFILPVVIMLGVYVGKGIYPFGPNTFLRLDMYHQYAPFLRSFAEKLGSGSLTYAWDIGLGSNYAPLFAYYLASPFYLLVGLCPTSGILEFMSYVIVAKVGLCGLTMALFLSRKYSSRSWAMTVMGICYALCGYVAAYSWCLMWLDVLILTPVVILGLEKLIKGKNPLLYTLSLALAVFTNYYIAFMLCIFLVIWFIGLMITDPPAGLKEAGVRIGRFALYSLLAAGISCVLLMPCLAAMQGTASAGNTLPKTWENYFSFLDMLARHLVNVTCEEGLDHWPNIYCGIPVLLCLPFYYLNKRISFREKLVKTAILGFLLLSFSTNVLNFLWHGMHYPNSLPARQSFLYTFVLLVMCFEGLRYSRRITKKQLGLIFLGGAVFILLMQRLNTNEDIHFSVFYVSLLLLAVYALFFYLDISRRIMHATMYIVLIGVLVIESGMNTAITSVNTVDRGEYWGATQTYHELAAEAQEGYLFTRVERNSRRTKNDGAWIDYDSASVFSSTTQKGISDIYKVLGLEGNTNAYCYNGATPLTSSILSVSHVLSERTLDETPLLRLIDSKNGINLYENTCTLPIGFMLPADFPSHWIRPAADPAATQNSFVAAAAGTGDVLRRISGSSSGNTFTAEIEEDAHVFLRVDTSQIRDVTVAGREWSRNYDDVDRGYLIDAGYCKKGDIITIRPKKNDDTTTMVASAYAFDDAAFMDAYNELADEGFVLTDFTNTAVRTSLTGEVTAKEDGVLFFSIPYDKGWSVTVDGREADTQAVADAFVSVPLSAGSHTVTLTWHLPALKAGLTATLASLALLVICCLLRKYGPRLAGNRFSAVLKDQFVLREDADASAGYSPEPFPDNPPDRMPADPADLNFTEPAEPNELFDHTGPAEYTAPAEPNTADPNTADPKGDPS